MPRLWQGIAENSLGSPPAYELLRKLRPSYWFSAHMHVRFQATVRHDTMDRATAANTNTVEDDGTHTKDTNTTQSVAPGLSHTCRPDLPGLMTQFLALDKCLPRRQYLAFVNVPIDTSAPKELQFDLEWLAILRKTHHLSAGDRKQLVHPPASVDHVTEAEIEWVRDRLGNNASIPKNFHATIPTFVEQHLEERPLPSPLPRMGNPQTDQLLELLDLEHIPNLTIPYNRTSAMDPV
jgi:lariat debranching enzyme